MREEFFDAVRRFFARWRRISSSKIPRAVRGKLYKRRYVIDRQREYKKEVYRWSKIFYFEDDGHSDLSKRKKFKKVKYYYRKLK